MRLLATAALAVLAVGCGGEPPADETSEAAADPATKDHVWSDQTKTLDKARDVQKTLDTARDKRSEDDPE